jgi:hypothetical protein
VRTGAVLRGDIISVLRNAPGEIRTATVQAEHKALNLARDLPDPSERRGNEHLFGAWTIWT